MARQKSRKTATKRLKASNPRGNRKAKIKYSQSHNHHLRTKLSKKSKRRKSTSKIVDKSISRKHEIVMSI